MDLKEKYNEEEIYDYIKVVNSYPVNKKTDELNRKIKEENIIEELKKEILLLL